MAYVLTKVSCIYCTFVRVRAEYKTTSIVLKTCNTVIVLSLTVYDVAIVSSTVERSAHTNHLKTAAHTHPFAHAHKQ